MLVLDKNGNSVELPESEVQRIIHWNQSKSETGKNGVDHRFLIGNVMVSMTESEMKTVADYWWKHFGKNEMIEFYENYKKVAAENIRKALGYFDHPKNEKEVKGAICAALNMNDSEVISEVIFEAMEWQTAYSQLKNFEK